jgi:hypothetical protein
MRLPITLAILTVLTAFARADGPATSDVTAQLTRGLRMKLVPAPEPKPLPGEGGDDPLAQITDKMTQIVGDLAGLQTDVPVQDKQKQVVSDLDEIIKQLEQACKAGNGGSRNPTKPMRDSMIAKGPGGMGELIDPKTGTRNLNNLPPKVRDQIMQSKTEGFPPGYESLLQSYYQRLAQEKVGDEASKPAAPAGK